MYLLLHAFTEEMKGEGQGSITDLIPEVYSAFEFQYDSEDEIDVHHNCLT